MVRALNILGGGGASSSPITLLGHQGAVSMAAPALLTLRALFIVVPWLLQLFVADIALSALLPVALFAPTVSYNISSAIAYSVWKTIQWIFTCFNGAEITVSGSPLPPDESAIVVANHVGWTDFYMIQELAIRSGMLGRCRWFAKRQLKWVPFLGWGLWAMGMPLVSRNWITDQREIENVFGKIVEKRWPIWLISYSEGTRYTRAKYQQAVEWCKSNGKPVPQHTLYPRTRGFIATVNKLRESQHVKAVYDISIAYATDGKFMVAPSMWQTMSQPSLSGRHQFYVHVERYPIDDLPQSDDALAQWLEARWMEKSTRLEELKVQLASTGTWRHRFAASLLARHGRHCVDERSRPSVATRIDAPPLAVQRIHGSGFTFLHATPHLLTRSSRHLSAMDKSVAIIGPAACILRSLYVLRPPKAAEAPTTFFPPPVAPEKFKQATMKSSILVAVFGVLASATPASNYAVHEKRREHPQWTKVAKAPADRVMSMRVGLQQNNLDQASHWLDEWPMPTTVQPRPMTHTDTSTSDETINSVRDWLRTSGIHKHEVSLGLNWINFNATVAQAEDLLKADYSIFEHDSGALHVACDSYSLPAHVGPKVDFILPTVHFDRKLHKDPEGSIQKRAIAHNVQPGTAKSVGSPSNGFQPKQGFTTSHFRDVWKQLENCDKAIVPNCLRALYEFPPGFTKNRKNSYGIVEYTPQACDSKQIGNRPILASIDGGVVQQTDQGFNLNGESNLDLEYAMALVYPQNVTLYQVGDEVEGASFNDFLDGIDKSYCTAAGGDDPEQDATYPDPAPGGYKGPKDCGKYAPTKVISTSYGYNEADLTPAYEQRQCNEYMKLGLLGVSVLYSSGDNGVAGNGGACIDPATGEYNDGSSGLFNPSFPSTCPYITSVGATQVKNGTNVVKALATGVQPEMACETVIYSGGGFSNVFPLPKYQSAAVKSYFANHNPPYTAAQYNNSKATRGFPDISANGANYVITVQGQFSFVYGTSASSPTLGSIVTLINEARLAIGKSSVGFINPVAYAHPGAFNDIVVGGNQGCGTAGYQSVTGWDPVTGLGTPNFPKLLKIYLGLP
ncbi:hypothetical protein FH972_024008 [Carpinus fangiana]|uniref:tripeptidyl-peptidase II n=1 Tax=Carpinus fangiana TaxID=176857 RepID=A0A5N6KX57_9ROSI|nr:hypothetical protein FH972_024008 [Carpinus fangiana]